MLLKYYNCIMNLNFEKTIIEAWNIYCREKDEDNIINKSDDSFKTDLQNVLCFMNVQMFNIISFYVSFALSMYVVW